MVAYRAVLLVALLVPHWAQAQTLRLCIDEKSHLPFITPNLGGTVGLLIQQAAREVGVKIETYTAPITRCREEIRANVADGFPSAPNTPALQPFMTFPMQKGKPDAERAVLVARAMVFKRKDSPAHWDGRQFTRLTTPVLINFGAVLLVDRLAAMGIPADDKGKTLDANMNKLLAGRADVALGAEYSGYALLADPQYAGKIDTLPLPFSEEPYYLGLSKRFYDANPAVAEQLWNAIGRIRKTPAYQDEVQKAIALAARTLKE